MRKDFSKGRLDFSRQEEVEFKVSAFALRGRHKKESSSKDAVASKRASSKREARFFKFTPAQPTHSNNDPDG
jgi:hypothetical protein